jgi:transglutaminase/protease-like cytokinesis protein 3
MTFVLLCFAVLSFGQNNALENKSIILSIPDEKTQSVNSLSKYIEENFETDSEKLNAIYTWITYNISYDIKNLREDIFFDDMEKVLSDVLKNKKGVCMHYSLLFDTLAKKSEIESYIVFGYTKQNDTIMNLPHAWNICRIDSTWKVFDATWGAGYIMNDKFFKDANYKYFSIDPGDMIKTHMPYDPLWQLSFYPITNQEFYNDIYLVGKDSKRFFNYNDTIEFYKNKDNIEILKARYRRVEGNGIVNSMIIEELTIIDNEILHYETVNITNYYNKAVEEINKAANNLNIFIDYRNKQFQNINDEDLIKIINSSKNHCVNAELILDNIQSDDKNIMSSVSDLKKFIIDMKNNILEQKKFLNKYVTTPEYRRKQLFYR